MDKGKARSQGPAPCEGCSEADEPLRDIKIKDGERERLCFTCFIGALEERRVHPEDPRLKTSGQQELMRDA